MHIFKFCQQVVTLGCLVSWCSRKCCNRIIGNLLEEPPSLYDMGCARWLLIALADPSSAGGDFNSNSSPQLVQLASQPVLSYSVCQQQSLSYFMLHHTHTCLFKRPAGSSVTRPLSEFRGCLAHLWAPVRQVFTVIPGFVSGAL